MRKILLFFIALCAMMQTSNLMAQEEVMLFDSGQLMLIPKHFTIDNKPLLYIGFDYYDESEANIYDANFKKVKNFTVTSETRSKRIRIEERKAVTDVFVVDEYKRYHFDILDSYEVCSNSKVDRDNLTIDQLIEMWKYLYEDSYIDINPNNFYIKSTTDSTAIFYPNDNPHYFYYFEEFGTKYPVAYYTLYVKGYMVENSISYERNVHYTGDWEITEKETGTEKVTLTDFDFYDYDSDNGKITCYFSQTLFNDDEKIEYLIPVYDESLELYSQNDRDKDGEIDYKEYRNTSNLKGYNIYSDGELKGFLNIPIKFDYHYNGKIFNFGGKTYIEGSFNKNNEYYKAVYRINKSTNSVEQVTEPVRAKMSVKKDIVNIQFKEAAKEGCELIVTASDGRLCEKTAIAAGSENVKYDTRALTNGIYNFTVMQNGIVIESGKIVVR